MSHANSGFQTSDDRYGGVLLYHMGDMVEALFKRQARGV